MQILPSPRPHCRCRHVQLIERSHRGVPPDTNLTRSCVSVHHEYPTHWQRCNIRCWSDVRIWQGRRWGSEHGRQLFEYRLYHWICLNLGRKCSILKWPAVNPCRECCNANTGFQHETCLNALLISNLLHGWKSIPTHWRWITDDLGLFYDKHSMGFYEDWWNHKSRVPGAFSRSGFFWQELKMWLLIELSTKEWPW